MSKKGKKIRKGLLKEFKEFIMRGNVVDLAVGLVIGNAFTAIVKSLTNDVIMPFIGGVVGGVDFAGLRTPLWNSTLVLDSNGNVVLDAYGQKMYSSAIYYGRFIQAILDFFLIALVIFLMLKALNAIRRRLELRLHKENQEKAMNEPVVEPVVEEVVPTTPEDIELLREIRDLLKK